MSNTVKSSQQKGKKDMFKQKNPLQQPLFTPDSSWTPPEFLPDLSSAKEIAIDLETWDPNLRNKGAGWARKDGQIVGIAVATDGWQGYLPIRHRAGGNLDENAVMSWMKDVAKTKADKVCHNASYDIGWLKAEGIEVKGRIIDTMIGAPLIDENRFSYSLNNLGKTYLQETKSEELLYDAAQAWGVDAKAGLYQIPPMYVGPYAEQDAAMTLRLWNWQKSEISRQDLWSIFDLETSILPLLIDMRMKGVKVDLEATERLSKQFQAKEMESLHRIKQLVGEEVEIWANASIEKAFKKLNLSFNYTEKGSPSFQQSWLEAHEHEFPQLIVKARKMNKARTTFIDGMLMRNQQNGRIHAELHPLRSDDGGTVTGRFSYSNPNLQQVPARDPEIGAAIRSLFIPEDNCEWGAFDYSQQEPRLVVHYAEMMQLRGA